MKFIRTACLAWIGLSCMAIHSDLLKIANRDEVSRKAEMNYITESMDRLSRDLVDISLKHYSLERRFEPYERHITFDEESPEFPLKYSCANIDYDFATCEEVPNGKN